MNEELIRSLSVREVPYAYRLLRQPNRVTEPALVLGGALQGMYGWPQMEEELGPVTDVVTADLPGMGSAGPLPPGPSMEVLCAAILGVIDDLGASRINLFGFSYGAGIAFSCAQRFPERIARLVLGGVPADVGDVQVHAWQRAAEHLSHGDTAAFATRAAEGLLCLDERRYVTRRKLAFRYVRRAMLQAALHSPHAVDSLRRALTDRPDFAGGLPGIPTLVFSGEHDTVTTPDRQRAFAATLADSRFLTIPDTDHWVVLERPQEVAELTARFFTDGPLETAPALAPVAREGRAEGDPACV
ncbi:alpha/beta fold hydrolase [Streptomyces sp. GS7]|uniref:alpha/beta fold hydrolase n=1 Tax=Streptomyces sp. GS7 TaxID=2692234 RepID=UPI0013174150|nr:alpha/beta hydrolase [Streptomyces sp. GS7]QHC24213.1 alpha/beta fold hydrolase [Streptomyces sp. GS7]